jgi:ATP-dependent DNA ligase
VIGGYRLAKDGKGIGSLLLGLYDIDGALHHVGHTSSFDAAERRAILAKLQPLVGGDSFGQGRTPGGPSRWQRSADSAWTPVRPELVCEVSVDHLQSGRFRHASRFLRWRPDKDPRSCDFDQLSPPEAFSLDDILVTRG